MSARRLFVVSLAALCAMAVAVAFSASAALAAAPETPETAQVGEVSNTTAELRGIVDPHSQTPVGAYYVYAKGASCTGAGEDTTQLQPETSGEANTVTAEVVGLDPGSTYTYCVVARNAEGETAKGGPVSFTTTSVAPSVDDQYVSEAAQVSARLNAQVNSHGSATRYHFEYGTTPELGFSTPVQSILPGHRDALATAPLAGLDAYTRYYAHVVAESEAGIATSKSFTFLTLANGGVTMPDGRVWEMVTPVQNDDADIYAPESGFTGAGTLGDALGTEVPFQVSEDGTTFTYAGDPVTGGNGSGGSDIKPGNQLVAHRTASGWHQQVIAVPGGSHSYYEAFSPDLSVGVLRAGNGYGETEALLPETEALSGGYHVLYTRDTSTLDLHALFTRFYDATPPGPYGFQPQFVGGSRDFSTMVFDANAPLSQEAPEGRSVYESVGGKLSLVNRLPEGTIEQEAQAGGPEEAGGEGLGSPEFSHAVSSDGSRIFWTGLGSHPNLYMREDGARTVQIDASQAGGPGGGGKFWTASDNGERVFFTDGAGAKLTANTVAGSGENLYEYDVAGGRLTDLTPSATAEVQGVIGASEDGSYIYFVANGALAAGASAGNCVPENHPPQGNSCSLYVRQGGVTDFIARLSNLDGMNGRGNPDGGGSELHGAWREGLGHRTAQVSADGTLVFQSELSLTGYRNEDASEVYVYTPTASAGEQLACASCSPSEEPIVSGNENGIPTAGVIPQSNRPAEAMRVVSADGDQVFFDSPRALLPQDSNGELDVYEWERDGSGSCDLPTNCVSLLSGGTALSDSYLAGISPDGNDVMIITRAQLVGADRNENYDVYDVRVDGTQPPAPEQCNGTGCQGLPPAPPIFATPASVSYEGLGNFAPPEPAAGKRKQVKPKALTRAQRLAAALRACRRKHGKPRSACIREARRRYGPNSRHASNVKHTSSKAMRSGKGGK